MKHRTQPVDVGIITRGGATMGDDKPIPNIRLAARKKVQFDVDADKENFFDARDILNNNMCNSPIYEIPPTFDSTAMSKPSWKVGTLQNCIESCMLLAKDPDALAEIVSLLHR